MLKNISPSELILAILVLAKNNKEEHLDLTNSQLHLRLYKLSSDKKFKFISRYFPFDTRDINPISENLEYAVNSLLLSGYLERVGLGKSAYHLPKKAIDYYQDEIKKSFQKNEIKALESLALEF